MTSLHWQKPQKRFFLHIHLFIYIYIDIQISVCSSISSHLYLPICLSVCLSIYSSIYLSNCLPTYLSIRRSIYLSIGKWVDKQIQFDFLLNESINFFICLFIYLFLLTNIRDMKKTRIEQNGLKKQCMLNYWQKKGLAGGFVFRFLGTDFRFRLIRLSTLML